MKQSLDGFTVIRVAGLDMRRVDLAAGLALAALACILMLLSLSAGSTELDLVDLLWPNELNDDQIYALYSLRIPRTLTGFLAGAATAVAGAILQSLTRNPIADPGLLGLAQGALLAILCGLFLFPGLDLAWMPLLGCGGGLAIALFLIAITQNGGGGRNGGDALTLLLLGLAVETTLSSVTSIVVLYAPTDLSHAISLWLAGSLYQADWRSLSSMLPWLGLALPLLFLNAPMLRILELGEERATAMGLNLPGATLLVLSTAVLLTSTAVSVTGPLVFLGIIAPHICTFLRPSSGRARLVLTGLVGGCFVVAADTLSRTFGTEIAVPIGLSLTLLGVPIFIIVMRLRAASRANQES